MSTEREYRTECKHCNGSAYLRLRGEGGLVFVRCPRCGQTALARALPPVKDA